MKTLKLVLVIIAVFMLSACEKAPADPDIVVSDGVPGVMAPVTTASSSPDGGVYPDPTQATVPPAASVVMGSLPTVSVDPAAEKLAPRAKKSLRPRTMVSPEEADRMRAESLLLEPQSKVQVIASANRAVEPAAPSMDTTFETLNFDDVPSSVPPDPEMAAGPNHVVAVVNTAIEIYTTSGATLSGPTLSDTFFSGVSGCSDTFDPNVLYDEKEDRFFIGFDSSNGPDSDNGYCFAVSASGDPTGSWYRYSFDATSNPGDFFDYPHAGIGEEAIFVGGNIFNNTTPFHADVWAIRKADVYANAALGPANFRVQTIGGDTPQPMNAHGYQQGTWPSGNTHYILSDGVFNGSTIEVHAWTDPFGADTFTSIGTVNLNGYTLVSGGMPVDSPQNGAGNLQANDFRLQDSEYRNGSLWMSQTIACNPGAGTVNCVRWAEIDPTGPTILQAGVFASDGEYRTFADLAVNHCGDMTIGYTKSSTAMFPGVFYTGRLGSDAADTVGAEAEMKAGGVTYNGFDGGSFRWGDYSGATSDPDGVSTWYLGEYSRANVSDTKWATAVGRFSTNCVAPGVGTIFSDGFESNSTVNWSSQVN